MDIPYYPILCIYNIYILYIFYIYIYIYIILHIHCMKNHIFFCQTPWKDNLSKKKTRKYDIFFKLPEKMLFPKRAAPPHDLSCIIWKDCIFFPKKWHLFPWQKVRGGLFQEIHGNMTFSVHTYGCYKRGATPLCQKKSNMVLSRKNTPKGDWRSRLTS